MNLDRSIFACFSDFGPKGFEAVVDPSHDRAEVIENIRRGEFAYTNIVKVLEFNAAEGWSRDVTDEILAAAERFAEAAE